MNKSKFLALPLALLLVLSSCEKDSSDSDLIEPQTVDDSAIPEITLEVTEDVVGVLKDNYFNVGDVKVINFYLPDGSVEQRYQIEDDITFSVEHIDFLREVSKSSKNYHTNNLVNPGTLTIIGYTGGGGFGLSNKRAYCSSMGGE